MLKITSELSGKKKIICFALTAVIYAAVACFFKWLISGVTIVDPQPAAAMGPVLGIMFGWPAILGCAFGDFIVGALYHRSLLFGLVVIPIDILYAYIPTRLWRQLSEKETNIYRLDSARRTFRYVFVMACGSVAGGFLLGIAKALILKAEPINSMIFSTLANYDECMLVGVPLMILMSLALNRFEPGNTHIRNRSIVEKILLYTVAVEAVTIILFVTIAGTADNVTGNAVDYDTVYRNCIIIENLFLLIGLGIVGASISTEKVIRRFQFISFFFVLAMCIVALVNTYRINLSLYESFVAANLSTNVTTLVIITVLYAVCIFDRHTISKQSTWYMLLLLTDAIGVFINSVSSVFPGRPEYARLSVWCDTLIYETVIISFLFSYRFFRAGLNITRLQYRKASAIFYTAATVATTVVMSNPWTGLMFTVDENGYNVYNDFGDIDFVCIVIMGIVIFYILLREKALLSEKIALGMLVAFPLISEYIEFGQTIFYMSNVFCLASVIFCFGVIYTKRSSELGEKQKDLDLAASVQESRLPKNFDIGSRENFDIYASMDAAKEVGGDFYDFFEMGEDRLAFGIADVSGKGSSAAIFMMRAITTIKNFATSTPHLADAITNANNSLNEHNEALLFVTAWAGVLDFPSGLVRYVNAGHNLPYVIHPDGSVEQINTKPDTMLAFFPGIKYHSYDYFLKPGDILFLFTDGVTDAESDYEAQFGEERLVEALKANAASADCRSIIEAVQAALKEFMGHATQFDDITMLALKYNKKAGE